MTLTRPDDEALNAGEAAHEIGLTLSVETGDADDLTRIERELDLARIMPYPASLHAQHRRLAQPLGNGLRCQSPAALGSGDQFKYARLQ